MYKQNKENKICFNKPVINVLLVKYFYPFWIIFQNKFSVCIKFQVYYTCLKLFIDTWLKVKVAQSCLTLCNPGRILQARILKWVGSLSLLQGIFPTQGLNPDLLHCRQILYQLNHKDWTQVSCTAGGLFTNWAIREVQIHDYHEWIKCYNKRPKLLREGIKPKNEKKSQG